MGSLPREGVVADKFVPSLESLSSLGFEERNVGCLENFAGMSQTPGGSQKVCAKKGEKAHRIKKVRGTPAGCPWETRRDKQGSTGRCPRDFLLFTIEELTTKGPFCQDTGRVSQGHPSVQGAFRNLM